MSLASQLLAVQSNFEEKAPPSVVGPITDANKNFQNTYQTSNAIQVGDSFPSFSLPNQVGEQVAMAELLTKGPLLITFYRGEWCPFCNLALHAMQKHLSEFQSKGVTLVAISPELPNQSLSTVEKHALQFPVLSDAHNELAKQLGILFAHPDTLRPVFKQFGHDLETRNGDDSFEVPLPASFLVGKNGIVVNSFINPDWTKRLEPSVALEWVATMDA